MAKATSPKPTKAAKKTSPFKDQALFEKEITAFANKFKATVVNHAKRISDYFEISCFNQVVKYYENFGYVVTVENLQSGQYRYKCTPSGIQSNFSHFNVVKDVAGKLHEFEIQHNLAVQSSHDDGLFTTPDISVIAKGSINYTKEHYDTRTTFSYVLNSDCFTFCEVKQFSPFPELLFNFIGIVNELRKDVLSNSAMEYETPHIAPSLMVSGKPSKPVGRIKEALEKRYCINLIFDLFSSSVKIFNKASVGKLKKAGRNKVIPLKGPPLDTFIAFLLLFPSQLNKTLDPLTKMELK